MSNVQFPYYPFNFRLMDRETLPPAPTFYWSETTAPTTKPLVKNDGWKLSEDKTKYTIEFECPGSTKEDVTAELKDFTLTLAATYKGKTKTKTVELPWDADEREVGVTVKNGILRVEVKLHEDTKPKSIPIK